VKLLLDQNLSRRLVSWLAGTFPGKSHVALVGLERAPDDEVWNFARKQGFTLVTKDSDFADLTLMWSAPPKVVWLRLGNCTTADVERVLRASQAALAAFDGDPESFVMELL